MGVFGNTFGKLYSYSEVIVPEAPEVNTIYIDFDSVTNGVGTIEDPKNTYVGLTFLNDYTYKAKLGTTITTATPLYVSGKSNITFTTYGTGDKPEVIVTTSGAGTYCAMFTGCTNLSIIGWDLSGNSGLGAIIRTESSSNTTINNCRLHDALYTGDNAGWGVYAINSVGLKLLNSYIGHVGNDGFYCRENSYNLEIGYCHFEYVNQSEPYTAGNNPGGGDGIQLNGRYNGFYIHHNLVDRNVDSIGNKYCLLVSQGNTATLDTGIIEYNTFRANANVFGMVIMANTINAIIRYNVFEGTTDAYYVEGALKLTNITTVNLTIHHNIFRNIKGRAITLGYGYSGIIGASIGTKILNNVFYNIKAGGAYNGCIWNDRTSVECKNNIFHMNGQTGEAFINFYGATWNVTNNCFDDVNSIGDTGGTAYVTADPKFVDAENNNFKLQSTSPCINAGVNVNLLKDYDGINIPQGVAPDIGAYEFI